MKRVMIVGQPGSGKSRLAHLLGNATGLPIVHMDQIHWTSGWVERDWDEKTRMCLEIHARDAWIFEGGHSATWPDRLNRCDTLIWLDYPLWLRTIRVFRRTLKDYGKTRADLPEGCPERFDPEFYRFIWKTRKTSYRFIEQFFENAPGEKSKVKLSSNKHVQDFLQSVVRRDRETSQTAPISNLPPKSGLN